MEKKLLQEQQQGFLIYYSEDKLYKKVKTNFALVVAILVVCFIMRLNKKNVTGVNESIKREYIDIQSYRVISKFNHSNLHNT
jgi:hypothetical protein